MSPRTKEQNEQIREARIRQIRRAAADVYLARGLAFEIKDVAAQAEVGYGTVYHYYSNKFLLLRDLLEQAASAARELTDKTMAEALPARERLRLLSVRLLGLWSEERSVFILYKMASEKFHQLPEGSARALAVLFDDELYRPVADAMRECVGSEAAEETANMLIGSLVGCAGLWLYRSRSDLDAERMADLLFEGIRS
ncbi:TetR/AcrR family transcriptional regulator [Cohnella zeiphila]|uniref:TetR/AcrR family transcriptional regulator n=1 Tax=Cohnella zeiphila TaxID=2761120 RepID=A0A7X0VTL0_9BACL|nr:TetR/AcrR family transcriptional regulator [Cohnella zeiphila]MBB6729999.1 TetR/AcrR family transcriptional regulator [Cohnella zeiphila]